jgi:hypothetical protein
MVIADFIKLLIVRLSEKKIHFPSLISIGKWQ